MIAPLSHSASVRSCPLVRQRQPVLHRAARALVTVLVLTALACRPAAVRSPGPLSFSLAATTADSLRSVLVRALADSAFPGAVAVAGNHSGVLATVALGHLDWAPSATINDSTLWDLASLTKVIGLTSAIMQLTEAKLIDIDAPVQRYLPEWTGPHKDEVTVRHLLTHSSGLPAWRALYKEAHTPDEARVLALVTPLDTLPGVRMVYSDLGAILLGLIVERTGGEPLDVYLARHVFSPIGMTDTQFRPPPALWTRVAPTEYDPWRQRHVRGEVHDENAFALGGVSGHAGLFSSARDLSRLARLYLNGGVLDSVRLFRPETIARFTALQDSALSNRALGWEKPTGRNSAGHLMSPSAFGHTGFTGTSIWIDPAADAFVILLTNRVNPTRDNSRIGPVRIQTADAVMGVLERAAAFEHSGASGPRPR
jgi:CubicO group peptidase (beta-lactamase class C family)